MNLVHTFKKTLKKHSPHLISLYRDYQTRRTYNRRYFSKSYNECLDLIQEVNTVTYDKYLHKEAEQASNSNVINEHKATYAVVEINNTCNLNCLMCKTNLSTRPKKAMKEELLEDSLKRLTSFGINRVELHTIGDPLANPKLEAVFEMLRKYSMMTTLTTNGLLLNKYASVLIEYMDICSMMCFSIDGANAETYEKIRAGGNWEQLLKNLKLAQETLVPAGYYLKISIVVSKDNINELGNFLVNFRSYLKFPHKDFHFTFINSLSPDNSYFDEVNLFQKHTYNNTPCSFVSNVKPHILVDGRVSVCGRDYDGTLVIGNIQEKGLTEILSDKPLKELRFAHDKKEFNQLPLCQTCYVIDKRIIKIFNKFMEYIIYNYPKKDASFYQEKINLFISSINEKISIDEFKMAFDNKLSQ